jgi:hypothetical protein
MNRKKSTRIIIEKKGTDSSSEYDKESDSSSDSSNYSSNYTTNKSSDKNGFVSIVDSGYKKSKYGSKQDNMIADDIVAQLDNYVALKTIKEKKILKRIRPFKTWIRYLNLKNKKFRVGGLLMKVVYPDYIMLVNPKLNLTWSVQLQDNIIYIPDKDYKDYKEYKKEYKEQPLNDLQKQEMKKKKEKEEKIKAKGKEEEILKEHLLLLYKNGKLALKKKD